jgi:hypothetical protein
MIAEHKLVRKLERELESVKAIYDEKYSRLLERFHKYKKHSLPLKNRMGSLRIELYETYYNNDKHNRYSFYAARYSVILNTKKLDHKNMIPFDITKIVFRTIRVRNPLILYMYGLCLAEQLFLKYEDECYIMHDAKSGDLKEFKDDNIPQ